MKIAALQMVSAPDLAANLATAERLIDQAAADGAQLVSLPEYFVQMGLHETDKFQIAEEFGRGPTQEMLAAKAQQHAIWVAGGSIPMKTQDPAKVTNTALLFNPQGEVVARYNKMHLFSYQDGTRNLDEGRTMVAGREVVTANAPWGRIGMSICYDLRFPELYRAMGEVDLILAPSAFTVPTGSAHWRVLLTARAIENQCYVLAAAQGGTHANGRQTYGHSMLVDPWGEVVSELPHGEGVVMGELNPERLNSVRHNLQALKHRRLNTIGTLRETS